MKPIEATFDKVKGSEKKKKLSEYDTTEKKLVSDSVTCFVLVNALTLLMFQQISQLIYSISHTKSALIKLY